MITVTKPVDTPTNLQATLLDGGNLAANTTYYFIVIAYDQYYFSPYAPGARYCFHSDISSEGNFTTDTVKKSVKITWDNASGATRYQILLTTTSGDYTNSGGYGTALENVGNITDGPTGYTITDLSSETYVFHTIQLVNQSIGDISNDLGIIKVLLSETNTYTLDDIYDSIIDAGFTDYIFYDGYNFIFKGWIIAEYPGDAGNLIVEKKNLIFIKGGIANRSQYYTMRFGRWVDDEIGAYYAPAFGCNIDIQNARYPFACNYSERIVAYGSFITFCNSLQTTGENLYYLYYIGGAQVYFTYAVDGFKDSILGAKGRSQNTIVKDLKWGQGNNWGNYAHIRLRIYGTANMPYVSGGTFYACKWLISTPLYCYAAHPAYDNIYTNFYDNDFSNYSDDMIGQGDFYFRTAEDHLTNNQYYQFNYSVKFTVVDENGTPLENVNINGVDGNGDPIQWIEHDGTYDKLVTGNVYTTDRQTDANGEVDYYTRSYKIILNPENTDYVYSYDIIKTNYYPITLTVSKANYKTNAVVLETLTEETTILLTLQREIVTISDLSITHPITDDGDEGEIVITAAGGDGSYQYSIDNGSSWQGSGTFSGLVAGTYQLMVKDSEGTESDMLEIPLIDPRYYQVSFQGSIEDTAISATIENDEVSGEVETVYISGTVAKQVALAGTIEQEQNIQGIIE